MNVRLFALWCILLGGLGQGIVSPRLPDFLNGSNALALASGVSASLLYFAIFLTSFFYGRAADRGRAFHLLSIGLIAYAIILLLFTYSTGVKTLFVLRFVEGIALSAIFVAADFILSRASSDEDRGRWLSYYGAALSVGLLFGPALLLISPSTKMALYIAATLTILTSLLSLRFKMPALEELKEWNGSFAKKPLFFGALYGFLEAGLVAVFAVLIRVEFTLAPEYCFLAIIISAALSSLLWGSAIDKFGPEKILRFCFVLLLLGSGFLLFGKNIFSGNQRAYGASILFGIVAGGLYPASFTWLLQKVPASAYGRASAAMTRAYGLGSLGGPLVLGMLTQYFGAYGFFSVLTSLGIIGFGITLFNSKGSRSE